MGCCNKTPCNDGPVAFTPVTAPTEELMAVDTLLFGLLKVAKTGINTLNISNPVAAQLATTIAGLAAENEYLKKLMSALSPLTVTEACACQSRAKNNAGRCRASSWPLRLRWR